MADSARITLQHIAQTIDAPLDQVMKVILGQPDVSEELRRHVFAALEEAGLVHLSRETSAGALGIIVPGALIGDYVGAVVQGVSGMAKQRGFSIILYNERSSKEEQLAQMLGAGSCKGVISIVPNNYHRTLALCHQYQRDYVLVDYQGDDEVGEALTVEVNNRQSIVNIMEHLFELGHRRIAFITGRPAHASARQRLQGYVDALEAAGIAYDAELVREGNWVHENGFEHTQALLALDDPPTAIVASNDLMAFGAMQAAREYGLTVGRDISITGFDDIDMAATVTPSLTTMRQPMVGLGEAAVDLLIRRINGEAIPEPHIRLATQLIIRESTGPLDS